MKSFSFSDKYPLQALFSKQIDALLKMLSPVMRWFLLAMILANLAGSMYRLLLPLQMKTLGASITQIGLGFSAAALIPLLFQYLGGWVSDQIGRLRTIFLGSVGGFSGYLIMTFAPTWQIMTLGIAIESFSQVAVTPSFSPFIAENSPPQHRGLLFGMTTTIFMVVGVIGPPLGGWIASTLDFRGLMQIGAIPYFLSFLLRLALAVWESRHAAGKTTFRISSFKTTFREARRFLMANNILLVFLLVAGMAEMTIKLSNELLPVYVEQVAHLGLSQIGILGSVYGLAYMLAAMPAGRLADRSQPRYSLIIGFILFAIGLVGIIFLHSFGLIAAFWFLFGIGSGFLNPILSTLLSHLTPTHLLGRMFGLYWTVRTAISLPISWIASQIWSIFSPAMPFLLTALISLLVGIVAFRYIHVQTLPPEMIER